MSLFHTATVKAPSGQRALFTKALVLVALLIVASWSLEAVLELSAQFALEAGLDTNHRKVLNNILDITCVIFFALIGALAFMRHIKQSHAERRCVDREREIMLAGISHDLRTPLTRIRLEIELSAMSEQAKAAIDQDLAQVETTLGQLMSYAQTSQTQPPKLLNLSMLLEQLIQREAPRWRAMNVKLFTDISDQIFVHFHQHDMLRIVTNLVDNALRYGRDSSGTLELSIKLKRREALALLEVADRGAGIEAHETKKLLRPFVRGVSSPRSHPSVGLGLGLGLAIVEGLVRRAGASLDLLQRQGGGLSAQIYLTCFQPAKANSATTVAAIPSQRPK